MDKLLKIRTLIDWLQASPTPYHAVEVIKNILVQKGYKEIKESDNWKVSPGDKVFIQRRDASLLAFIHGSEGSLLDGGVRIMGAHTDSPTLKVMPVPEKVSKGYFQLGVETYGGVLLNPWFDRDLSLAGRIIVETQEGLSQKLVDFERPIALIPSLAIHLDREANKSRSVNAQTDIKPILLQDQDPKFTLRRLLSEELKKRGEMIEPGQIIDFDLNFYDVQKPATVGVNDDFLVGSKLDNLLSCFIALNSLVNSEGKFSAALGLFDHEEVGSQSDIGAGGNMIQAFFDRLVPEAENRYRVFDRSLILSLDNAHGIHPNFPSKHEDNHGPLLNHGPVLKYDANQSYATSHESAAILKTIARQSGVELQSYVTRADMRCGSTIGPMTSAKTGVRTLDLGVPTFAMHSIRETAGAKDVVSMGAILDTYLETRSLSI